MFVKVGKTFLNLDHVLSVVDASNCIQVKDSRGQTVELVGEDAAAVLAAVNPPAPVAGLKEIESKKSKS